MMRNLKALGLVVVAMFAMTAVVASSAYATPVLTPEGAGHVLLTGEKSTAHIFNAGGNEVTCETANFDGTVTGNVSTATIEPTYSNCHAQTLLGKLPATVTMNGCAYEFHATEKVAGQELWKAHVDIECPLNAKIEVHVYSNGNNHLAGTSLCTITIGAQTNLTTAEFSNMTGTPDDITVNANVAAIAYETHGPEFPCGKPTEVRTNATYKGNTTVKATNTAGAQVNLTVSGT